MYKVLYRKYRPSKLKEVVGQTVIIQILRQILKSGSIPHSFIFAGTRGIGKTTIARIFAKAINCEKLTFGDACGKCANCLAIEQEQTVDIVEIDGASNNGVDEIRDLRDKCVFLPQNLKYKVYIIDEVHMLTTAAFNALLKTLEEPPTHVVFILATTEPHKIPKTIQSRCMNFSFLTLTEAEIEGQIIEVAKKEKITLEKEAAALIAKKAEGAMRDALVLLDKAVAYAGQKIDKETVLKIIGGVDENEILKIINSLDSADLTSAVAMLDALLKAGKSENSIIDALIDNFKQILLKISTGEPNLFKKLIKAKILEIFSELNTLVREIRYTTSKQNMLMVTLIKIYSIINKQETVVFNTNLETVNPVVHTPEKPQLKTIPETHGDIFASNPVAFSPSPEEISKDSVKSPFCLTEHDFKDLLDNAKKKFREEAETKLYNSDFLKSANDPDVSGLSGKFEIVLASPNTLLLAADGQTACREIYKTVKYPALLKEVNNFLPEITRVILLTKQDAKTVLMQISTYLRNNLEFIPNDFSAVVEKYAAYDKILKEVKTKKFDASAVFGELASKEQ